MKASRLADLVDFVAELTSSKPKAVGVLVDLLRAQPATATAAATIKKLEKLASTAEEAPPLLGEAQHVLRAVANISKFGFPAAASGACETLAKLAEAHPNASAEQLANALGQAKRQPGRPSTVNEDVVKKHTSALLTRAPGTSGFGEALAALKLDTDAGKLELRAIAERLGHSLAADATKTVALNKIAREHKISVETAAKAAALRGNSSA